MDQASEALEDVVVDVADSIAHEDEVRQVTMALEGRSLLVGADIITQTNQSIRQWTSWIPSDPPTRTRTRIVEVVEQELARLPTAPLVDAVDEEREEIGRVVWTLAFHFASF